MTSVQFKFLELNYRDRMKESPNGVRGFSPTYHNFLIQFLPYFLLSHPTQFFQCSVIYRRSKQWEIQITSEGRWVLAGFLILLAINILGAG